MSATQVFLCSVDQPFTRTIPASVTIITHATG